MAHNLMDSEITEQDSLLLTSELLQTAIFNISNIRGLFPEQFLKEKVAADLEMKLRKIMPLDSVSQTFMNWMEKGVYDALQKKYLKTLLFCVYETVEGPMMEEYAFSFSYSTSDSQKISMNVSCSGNKKGEIFNSTPNQMRSSACKMVSQLMRTLETMPEERTILIKLLYYDDVTPADYEPPFSRSSSEQEALHPWTKNPLRMEVGNVNSKHFVLTLKVKSVLDPCEYGNFPDDDFIVAAADDTQDSVEDKQHHDNVELPDILSNYRNISEVLTEGIVEIGKEGEVNQNSARKLLDTILSGGPASGAGTGGGGGGAGGASSGGADGAGGGGTAGRGGAAGRGGWGGEGGSWVSMVPRSQQRRNSKKKTMEKKKARKEKEEKNSGNSGHEEEEED